MPAFLDGTLIHPGSNETPAAPVLSKERRSDFLSGEFPHVEYPIDIRQEVDENPAERMSIRNWLNQYWQNTTVVKRIMQEKTADIQEKTPNQLGSIPFDQYVSIAVMVKPKVFPGTLPQQYCQAITEKDALETSLDRVEAQIAANADNYQTLLTIAFQHNQQTNASSYFNDVNRLVEEKRMLSNNKRNISQELVNVQASLDRIYLIHNDSNLVQRCEGVYSFKPN